MRPRSGLVNRSDQLGVRTRMDCPTNTLHTGVLRIILVRSELAYLQREDWAHKAECVNPPNRAPSSLCQSATENRLTSIHVTNYCGSVFIEWNKTHRLTIYIILVKGTFSPTNAKPCNPPKIAMNEHSNLPWPQSLTGPNIRVACTGTEVKWAWHLRWKPEAYRE